MVTSTSTPGSMEMLVICFTISDGEYRSIILLWILIWNLSQVLEPSPQGVLRVVILKILVGIRTGPLAFSFCFLAPSISSEHTAKIHPTINKQTKQSMFFSNLFFKNFFVNKPFSNDRTFRDVKVIRILWMGEASCPGFSGFSTLVVAWNQKTTF